MRPGGEGPIGGGRREACRLRRASVPFAVFLSAQIGFAAILEVTLNNPLSGFFLKPEKGSASVSYLKEKEYIIAPLMQTSFLASLRVEFGNYVAERQVSQTVIKKALSTSQIPTNALVGDHEISAHIVRQSISPDRPIIQVLFHASVVTQMTPYGDSDKENGPYHETLSNFHNETKYCVVAYVLKEMLYIMSFCALNERTKVCLAEIYVPGEWWTAEEAVNLNVFYSVAVFDRIVNCTEAFNQTERGSIEKNFISVVSLVNNPLTYEELKEDSNILVYVPQASFYPGSNFRMPVKLHSNSNLQSFVMKVKARHGVRVVGAEARNASLWKVALDLNHKLHGAVVNASAVTKHMHSRTVTNIFEWIFEVDEDAYGDDRGRINIMLEYEKTTNQKDFNQPIENRLVARVEIQRDNIYTIVPIVKTRELLNLAILTGKMQTYNIRIYSVTHSGHITDVTSQSTCHSSDPSILKVLESCSWVFLDGTESRGSSSISITAKFGRHTRFILFKVWVPEFPLEIELSDSELDLIKGWKIPAESQRSSRISRDADYWTVTNPMNPMPSHNERLTGRKDLSGLFPCDVRYQLAMLEIYAFFISTSLPNKQYFIKHNAKFRLTDILLSQTHITDTAVISLKGNIVEGLKPGRSEIQILSNSGKVVGTKEIIVRSDKVSVEKLEVDLLTGLSLTVDTNLDLPGTLLVRVLRHDQLKRKDKDGLLDISVKFDDGSVLPLHYFSSQDYTLTLEAVDTHAVDFGVPFSHDSPRIIAKGQSKGKLVKISVELGEICQRKASRTLAVGYLNGEIDFLKPLSELERHQNDAEQYKFGVRKDFTVTKSMFALTHISNFVKQTAHFNYDGNLNMEIGDKTSKVDDSVISREDNVQKAAVQKDVQQKYISYGQNLTSLEIGMYVLLGIFCLAVVIFGINCTVFVVRYKRKKSPNGDYKDTVNCAPDWVWISRDMLERNDINTSCSQALMPESDFNGNQSPSGVASSNASPIEHNACTSNRNSFASTYKGSECSIQITLNHLSECNPAASNERMNRHGDTLRMTNYNEAPSRPTPQQIRQYMENIEMSKDSQKELKKLSTTAHEERLRHIEEGAASGSDFEWDYEVLGVTYEELIHYFDNLKESTA